MKTLLTTLLALASSLAIAQKHSSISRSINDDQKILSISIHGTVDGKPIDYDRHFDVSGLTLAERTTLREHILDSLNVSVPEPPLPPTALQGAMIAPVAPRAPEAPISSEFDHSTSVTISSSSDRPTVTSADSHSQAATVGGKNPYTKEVNYDSDSGKLYLRYRFEKDGEDITYERTINARDKSQQERQRIIDNVEKEIGLPKSK